MSAFIIFLTVGAILYLAAMVYSTTIDSKSSMKFGKNILFVTAHPDDECMFFTPTIYALKERSNLYLLVLSNGGYDGLGKLREKEMEKAAKQMGFKDYLIIDSAAIPDGPQPWNVEPVVKEILKHLKDRKDEGIEIKTIVTFDEHGVSAHPNHISTYHACKKVQEIKANEVIESKETQNEVIYDDIDLYTLETVPLYRKYDAYVDIFMASSEKHVNFFLPTPYQAASALMIHHSQFVWYRKLFMAFSRYGYFNSLN